MSTRSEFAECRCIVFDAVGTLIHPDPAVVDVYASICRRYGSQSTPNEIRHRFQRGMSSRITSHTTSEETERKYWKSIVNDALGHVSEPEKCFNEIYEHFAMPESWRVDGDLSVVLDQLARREIVVAIASNFDHRLHSVMDGHDALNRLKLRIISSEIGWRKPAPEFFNHVSDSLSFPAEKILIIGDNLHNDVLAAKSAGLKAIWLTDSPTDDPELTTIERLSDLLKWIA